MIGASEHFCLGGCSPGDSRQLGRPRTLGDSCSLVGGRRWAWQQLVFTNAGPVTCMWLSELSICDSPSQHGGVPEEREGPGPAWTTLSLFFSLLYPLPGFHRKETFQLHMGRRLPASATGEHVLTASLLSHHSALRAWGLHLAPRWRNCGQGKPGSCPVNSFTDAPILCPAASASLLAEG